MMEVQFRYDFQVDNFLDISDAIPYIYHFLW
jgi:hypothetical protein